jgi:malate dehydrogenase (oxaloacetate-decarboxylating)
VAVSKLLLSMGVFDVILCDRKGALYQGRSDQLDASKAELVKITNKNNKPGSLADAMAGADVLIGLSAPGLVTADMVRAMNRDAIVLAMANPTPEIFPDEARAAGARIIGTGRSDFPNQINNVLAFPGIFRGALDVRASDINEEMKMAAAYAIADFVGVRLSESFIVPNAFDPGLGDAVGAAVSKAARASGVARV